MNDFFNHDLLSVIHRRAGSFKGLIHGVDPQGVLDVEFPQMSWAASFVQVLSLEDNARIRDDGNGVTVSAFNKPVVLCIDLKQK